MAIVTGRAHLAVVLEEMLFHPGESNRSQKTRGDDAVGIDVVAAHGNRTAGDLRDSVHQSSSLTSITSPATAAAATMAGLMSRVRPVGLPCRPLKLRFDDAAQTSSPSSLSGFMPRHIEQPALRHSNPAARNTSSKPSRSAALATPTEPGTTSALTCFATCLPLTMRAASRRSERRAF